MVVRGGNGGVPLQDSSEVDLRHIASIYTIPDDHMGSHMHIDQ